jgi:tetratricopeptide (TPR) repeat protein
MTALSTPEQELTPTATPRRFAWLRRPRSLIVLTVVAIAILTGGPHLRAWNDLRLGRSALEEYRTEAALFHLDRCVRVWPRHLEARIHTARAARRMGDHVAAQNHLDEARRLVGDDWSEAVAFEWALLRAEMGDLATVEEPLRVRMEKLPFLAPLVYEALAEGNRRMCRMRDALLCLDHWLAVDPDNAQAYYLRGEVHRQIGALNRAREEYLRALAVNAELHAARRHLVRCLVQVGRYQEAIEHVEKLRGVFPDDPDLAVQLARCQHDLGDRALSTRTLQQILANRPTFGPALRELGREAQTAREFADAEKWLTQAVRSLPFDYEGNWLLFQALQSQGKDADAKPFFAKAQFLKDRMERINTIETREMTLRPLDASLHEELGRCLLAVGSKESGLRWLLSAAQLAPQQPSIHAALADYYAAEGNAEKAAEHRRRADVK